MFGSKDPYKNPWPGRILTGILILVIIIVLFLVAIMRTNSVGNLISLIRGTGADTEQVEESDEVDRDLVIYNGKNYKPDAYVKTVLFLGVDKDETAEVNGIPGTRGQSDTILLGVFNTKDQTGVILQIPRDTMTDITIYNEDGEKVGTEHLQLCLQYAYGTSSKSCSRLTCDAVSNLLYGMKIKNYLTMYLDGIEPMTNAIGGVDVVLDDDYTEVDASYTKGTALNLQGEASESFVRSRDTDVTGSNLKRMARQALFVDGLRAKFQTTSASTLYDLLYSSGEEYLVSNITADTIKKYAEYDISDEYLMLPGKMTAGEEHDEYQVDQDKLYEMILDLFYTEVEDTQTE